MTDAVREAFERWMSEDGKWPDAVAHRYGHYVLAQTESAWKAWQAAISEQPREEMSPEFTDSARDALLWVLWHHQGGSSPIGQPIRFALGMGAHDRLSEPQINRAKRWASLTKSTTDDFHRAHPAPVERVTLTDEQILACIRSAQAGPVPMGMTRERGPYDVTEPTHFAQCFARAVIAEYERANGIGKGERA